MNSAIFRKDKVVDSYQTAPEEFLLDLEGFHMLDTKNNEMTAEAVSNC